MKNSRSILIMAFLLVLITGNAMCVSAKTYHIKLLTVGEAGNELLGGTADAFLEVKPGSGRIFLDSFPLTKLDTQISTRYANKIACDYLNMACDDKDFFYTIRADSTIVGGPSASGALTVLTIAALKDLNLKNDTVMTGTINSGGSIGPVGGVIQKAEAAQQAGFKRMLIPLFTINLDESANNSLINLSKGSQSNVILNASENETPNIGIISRIGINPQPQKNFTIQIIKIRNIDEALSYFTGLKINENEQPVIVPSSYNETMREIATLLCNRAIDLGSSVKLNESEKNTTGELLKKINNSYTEGDYYSSASYCFNLGVILRKKNLEEVKAKNPSQLMSIKSAISQAVVQFDKNLEAKNITTIPELETYIIVKERLIESVESLNAIDDNGDISSDELAYALERYYSGVFWSRFFNVPGMTVKLDDRYLEEACNKKLSEADERINYAELYLPLFVGSAQSSIDQANEFARQKNFKMCLFKASFAKAESNLLLSSISVGQDQVDSLSQEKINAAKKIIANEEHRGFFPIMGYSYYEYADSLRKDNDTISSLIFSEYSLELSNMEMYFPKTGIRLPYFDPNQALLVLSVFSLGFFVGIAVLLKVMNSRKTKNQGKSASRARKIIR